MNALWQGLKESVVHLCFPTKCLYCEESLPPNDLVLCSSCASLLELIDVSERCSTCFNPLPEPHRLICQRCLLYPSHYFKIGAAFNYEHLASALVKQLKYGDHPALSKGMAAYLVVQLHRLKWPLPDAIVPVPMSFTRRFDRGYNQSLLLAEELGKMLNRPIWEALKRRSGDFSQAALSLEQRRKLEGQSFKLRQNPSIQGKVLLVVDDVMTTGSTLERCAEVLSEGSPATLYALTFCRTLLND